MYEPPELPSESSSPTLVGVLQHADTFHLTRNHCSGSFCFRQFSRLFSRQTTHTVSLPPEQVPQGLYLYGDVGTGKTMLMDLFYNTLPSDIKRKRRVHFHAFMIDVHKRVHAMKAKLGANGGDPIAPVARDLANEAYVLCFDEFQV